MATDKRIVLGLFAGDKVAFYKFNKENRELFIRYFQKHFPSNKTVEILDVYQESLIVLWNQISEGKLTESNLTVDIFSYLVSIGRNKYFEELRNNDKYSRLKKGERVFKKRQLDSMELDDQQNSGNSFVLQSIKRQRELDSSVNEDAHAIDPKNKPDIDPNQGTEEELAERIEKQNYVREQINNMQEPCKSIIIDSWMNDMTDKELYENDKSLFPSVSAVRIRRYRCHQKLIALLKDWHNQLNN